jgi:DNA-binding NtrC family response regulator
MPVKMLVIDDEQDMLVLLERILAARPDYEFSSTNDSRKLPELLKANDYDVVLTDLKMPRVDGLQVLELVKRKCESTAVIIMTAYGAIESAVEATRKGAFDYITKPFRKERILHVIDQAVKWQGLQRENLYLRGELEGRGGFPHLLGASSAMQRLQAQIAQVAGTSATILITGESGSGKELAALAIHANSQRRDKRLIAVNCTAIPESLIESELFGHLKGSFTGALKDKKGLVEEADHGTLFLDEIGDLSLVLQVKLLRLLQEGEFKVIGENKIRKVDIRFVTATNKNLPEKIRNGEFREDLFYRLNVINIHLPPLRDRKEDIPLLVRNFIAKYNVLHKKNITGVSEEAMEHLVMQDWPGNVRELTNVIERGVIMAAGDILTVGDLMVSGQMVLAAPDKNGFPDEDLFSMPFKDAKDRLMEEFQAQYIAKALARHGGNVSQAAKECGLKRQYLHRLMRETNVDSKSFKKPGR